MSVFVDTSAIMALLDSDDHRHLQAVNTWMALVESDEDILTSNYVIVESISLLHSRFGAIAARRFADDLVPAMTISWVDQSLHDAATSAALAASGKSGPSIVDCASFELIRRLDVSRVFAYDRHFRSRGYDMVG